MHLTSSQWPLSMLEVYKLDKLHSRDNSSRCSRRQKPIAYERGRAMFFFQSSSILHPDRLLSGVGELQGTLSSCLLWKSRSTLGTFSHHSLDDFGAALPPSMLLHIVKDQLLVRIAPWEQPDLERCRSTNDTLLKPVRQLDLLSILI